MIDIETMGTKSNVAIVSIGAVKFDPRKGVFNNGSFYAELDWKNQGRVIDKRCYYDFWKTKPREIRKQLKGKTDLEEALLELSDWIPPDSKVWGNGPNFDIAIMEHAYDSLMIDIPWKFWNIRCCRTILDIYKSRRGEIGYRGFSGTNNHNALDDAINQAEQVCNMWSHILNPTEVLS